VGKAQVTHSRHAVSLGQDRKDRETPVGSKGSAVEVEDR
jgi:hypothetical protein